MFKIIVEMQHKLNKQTAGDNYLEKNLNWNSCIIAESGELLDSLGYKWWKKQEPDIENVKVEAIDLLHFVISQTIQSFYNTPSKKIKSVEKAIEEILFCFQDDLEYLEDEYKYKTIEQIVNDFIMDKRCEERLLKLKAVFYKLGMSNEDVYIAYIAKNCLNKFRQDYGYKNGAYIKNWDGREDNVVAFEIANKWGADEELFEQLYLDLEIYYKEVVLLRETAKDTDTPDYFKHSKAI